MTTSRRLLCICYGVIAVIALLGTWSQNLHYFGAPSLTGTVAAFGAFLVDLSANPATRSITIDIVLFLLAAAIWMILEARRLHVRYVWVYIVLAFLIAISVTFPLFLIARERRLAILDAGDAPGPSLLGTGDKLGLLVLVVVSAAICWFNVMARASGA